MIKKNFIARIELNYCMIWKNFLNLDGGKKKRDYTWTEYGQYPSPSYLPMTPYRSDNFIYLIYFMWISYMEYSPNKELSNQKNLTGYIINLILSSNWVNSLTGVKIKGISYLLLLTTLSSYCQYQSGACFWLSIKTIYLYKKWKQCDLKRITYTF